MALALFLTLASATQAFGAPAPTSNQQLGQRIGLCGELQKRDGHYWLMTAIDSKPIQLHGVEPLVTGAAGSSPTLEACVVGPELPRENQALSRTFTVTKIAVAEGVAKAVKEGWLASLKVCGPAVNEGEDVYIQYGPSTDQRVYLRPSADVSVFRSGRLNGPWCVHSDAYPILQKDGKLEIKATGFKSDWERSGFSVGNL
jgi:hypothetical protein